MFTYRTKLIAGFITLLLVSLTISFVDHFYIDKLYISSNKVEDALLKLDYFSRFQLALERSLMPPNDYLIHGDPAEKAKAMNLIKHVDFMFKEGTIMDLTGKEQALLKDAQTKFNEIKHLSKDIFEIENPVGNKAGAEMMERLDAVAHVVQVNMEKINITRYEKTLNSSNKIKSLFDFDKKIFWTSIFLLISLAAFIGLSINHATKELERKTQHIESAKREWENTFDAISDFVTIHDNDYNIIRANKATAERFNTTPQALIGKKCYELFHSASEPHPLCPRKMTVETGESAFVELEDPVVLGGIFLASTYPLVNEKGAVYSTVHIVKDITGLKKADQRVKDEAAVNKAVLTVAKLISSTMDEEEIIQEIVQITPSLVKSEACMLFLWDTQQNVFLPRASQGLEDNLIPAFKALRFKTGDFMGFDEVKDQKTTIVIEDPINSPLLPSELAKTFNIVTIALTPIISHGEVIGIVVISCPKICILTSQRIAIVEGIAAQAGISLKNAQLYHESMDRMTVLEQRMETIQVMHEIDKNILTSFNKDQILETAARLVHRIIPSDRVTIVLANKEMNCFQYVAGFGIDMPKGATVPFEDTNATEILKTGRAVSRPNISLAKNLLPLDAQFLEQGFLSDIWVPIKMKREVVALLNIGSYTVAAFTQEHLSTGVNVAAQLAVALEHSKLFSDLQELLINTVKTLTSTIDAKSPWTRGHSERVTELAVTLGRKMGLTQKEIDNLRLSGLLHDIGKIGTAEHIIDKPGRLTDEEFAIVREHPSKGVAILKSIKQFEDVLPGVSQHHERFDGEGYPYKLQKEEIHLFGRILAVADSYDAMVSDRPYRKSLGKEKAIDEIKRSAGAQFDPVVVDAFLQAENNGRLKTL